MLLFRDPDGLYKLPPETRGVILAIDDELDLVSLLRGRG